MFVIIVGGLSLLPYLISDGANREMPEQSPVGGEITEIGGFQIHYREWQPEGSPLGHVFLAHGMAGSIYTWRKTGPALAEAGYHVVAMDLPPFGYSAPVAPADAGTSQAALARELLEQVAPQAEAWTLIGHSMGAAVIASMAAEWDRTPVGLVFAGGSHDTAQARRDENPIGRAVFAYPPTQRWIAVVAGRRLLNEEGIARALESAWGSEPDAETVQAYLEPLQLRGTPGAFVEHMLTVKGVSVEAFAGPPALILWGENDEWVPVSSGRQLAEALPDSRMELIEGAGHSPMETHPEPFNALLLEFLAARREQ